MKTFGAFLMRGRAQACLMAVLFASLPLLNWLGLVIVALVTLRKGKQEGCWVLLCVILPAIVFAVLGHIVLPLINGVLSAILVWILALILRDKANWSYVLVIAGCVGVVSVLAIHGYANDINQWWQQKMLASMQAVNAEISLDTAQQGQIIKILAPIATGIQVGLVLLMSLGWLVLARNWQASLYNPGQLRPELQAIRMPIWSGMLIIILVAVTLLTQWMTCIDLLPVVLLPFLLAGLSLVHFMVQARKLSWIWLVLFYVFMVLFLPYVAGAIVILALLDSWMNLRVKFKR
jgi:hypothetical protein